MPSYESAFDLAPAFIAVLRGPAHVCEYRNAAFRDLVGERDGGRDLVGRPIGEAVPEVEGVFEILDRVYATGEPIRSDETPVRLRPTAGAPADERFVDFVFQPLLGPDGDVDGILVHGVDATERVKTGDEARLLMRLSLDVICSIDADGCFVRVSEAARTVWGYAPSELEGKPYMDFVHLDDHPKTVAAAEAILGGTPLYNFENRYIRRDGTAVAMNWTAMWSDADQRMLCVARDQTEAKQKEADLFESQERFRRAFDHSAVGKTLADADGRLIEVNAALCDMLGRTEDELLGRRFQDLTHADDRDEDDRLAGDLYRGEIDAYTLEKRYLHKDGRVVWVLLSRSAVRAADGAFLYYIAVVQDITAAREASVDLERARDAAEAADRAKSQFLAVMSHEIRTPLSSVLGFGELLLDTAIDDEQREYVGRINENGTALLRLINDILDLSKIEAGGAEIERAPFDLRSLISAVNHTFQPRAAAKDIALAAEIAAAMPALLLGDEHRIRQVLSNYVGNAIKFTDRGHVVVAADVTPVPECAPEVLLHIQVRDTGIGIPVDRMDRLFKTFSQVDSSTTRRYGGTGLGLAIVKRLADVMGGEAWAESTEGEGSVFHFTARLAAAAPVAPPPSARAAYPDVDRSLRILIAEDTESNRVLMLATLRRVGLTAVVVPDGAQAVRAVVAAAAAGTPYDVVLMDVQMPVMDGLAATKALRAALAPEQQPRIIAVTADALAGDRETCLRAGMDDYLAKPFSPQRFADLLVGVKEAAG